MGNKLEYPQSTQHRTLSAMTESRILWALKYASDENVPAPRRRPVIFL